MNKTITEYLQIGTTLQKLKEQFPNGIVSESSSLDNIVIYDETIWGHPNLDFEWLEEYTLSVRFFVQFENNIKVCAKKIDELGWKLPNHKYGVTKEKKNECVAILIEKKVDPKLINKVMSDLNQLSGLTEAIEEFLTEKLGTSFNLLDSLIIDQHVENLLTIGDIRHISNLLGKSPLVSVQILISHINTELNWDF